MAAPGYARLRRAVLNSAPDTSTPEACVPKPGRALMTERRFTSFAEFWPYYLSEHSKPVTRALHYLGTVVAIALLITLIAIGRWWLFPLAFLPGYAFAWVGHFFFEKNRPATFTYPLWSFMSDWKMLALMLTGRLK